MIAIILCDSAEDLAKVQQQWPGLALYTATQANPPKPKSDWLTGEQFDELMAAKGYKVNNLLTRKRYCELHGVLYEKRGSSYVYHSEANERIPNRRK
jgi:hypothetical protein